jgi:preprotein translocase subunit SecE
MALGGSKPDFEEADRRYTHLKQLSEAGEITEEEFDEQLKHSMVQDDGGRWWVKSRKSGQWHYHDGRSWVRGTPPGYAQPTSSVGRSTRRARPAHLARRKNYAALLRHEFAKISWPGWLPSWVNTAVAVGVCVAVVLALFFVEGSVWADASKPLDLTKYIPALSKEAQTASEDDPTATASPSPSPAPFLSPVLPPFLSPSPLVSESPSPSTSDAQSPQTASSSSPSPSTARTEEACEPGTDADEFAESLNFSSAVELANYLGLEGGKDQLARLLRDCADLDDLASSLGFDNSEGLVAYLGLDDRRKLASLLNSATDEGESVANDGKLVAEDDGKLATYNGGSAAKGAAGADEEAPSLTISNPLSPASSAVSPLPPPPPPPLPPPPPPKASEPSPPAAEEPPAAPDGFLSPPASGPSLD